VDRVTASLLDDVEALLARFVAFPSEAARVAATLWVLHTHVLDCFESTPRLAGLSAEPGSGQTRLLEVLELLVPRPVMAVNVSSAYLFRKVSSDDAGPATILFDEIDTVFGPKAKDNEDLRGLLNAGHRRGATSGRCTYRGKEVVTEDWPAFAAVALAGLGDTLPDTILTRSIVIRMRRRAPHEIVEPFRHRVHAPAGHALREQLVAWGDKVRSRLADAWPDMPPGIEDRDADVWEPLLAVADEAGGTWPDRARVAAVSLVTQSREGGRQSWGIRLLTDLRTIFDNLKSDALHTETLLEQLHNLDESVWADLRGKPLDSRGLARRLEPYEVKPKPVRIGETVLRGYTRSDLHDVWARYLPPPPQSSVTCATSATDTLTCSACGEPMVQLEAWQTSHPACEPAVRSA
jgi:hypothetical protein